MIADELHDGYHYNGEDSMNNPFPKIVIASPLNGEHVGLIENVRGCAEVEFPELLSLLVQSNNGLWYLQGMPQVKDGIWNADAQFGNPNSPPHDYKIVAVYGAQLTLKSYDSIPDGLWQSNVVTVSTAIA